MLLCVVVYAWAFQLQRPIEPFLAKRLGQSDRQHGLMHSVCFLCQSLGLPLVGRSLDVVGGRMMLVLVFLSTALGYFLLAKATTLTMLWISKIPGVLNAGYMVAQALVAQSTRDAKTSADRAKALGRLTTAYTIGGTLGPVVGGVFGTNGDYYKSARWAVIASVIGAGLALLGLPPMTTTTTKSDPDDEKIRRSSSRAIVDRVWPFLFAKTMSGVTNSALATTIPLMLRDLGFNEKHLGFGMAATTIIVAVNQGVAIGPLFRRFGTALPAVALMLKPLGIGAIAVAHRSGPLCVVATAACRAVAHVLATSLTTATTGLVNANDQGTLLGIEHGLFAAARVLGPILGTTILTTRGGFPAVCVVCAAIDALVALSFPTMVSRLSEDSSTGFRRRFFSKRID